MASESIAREADSGPILAREIIVNQLHALVQVSACFLKGGGGVIDKSIFLYSF